LVVVNVSFHFYAESEQVKLTYLADGALASALTAEHKYELEENSAHPETPEFLETFRSQGTWDIKSATGVDDVSLIRQFGSET
jgi:complement component 1 Q subcomponent-binding protein